ncbi:hypothetical protein WH52_11630 [Tenacibaculum holothuriorum]|uniref:SnoaL-like domain-containing protein n=1 Tax=Tenacibaculum holothuriorum TaxID=1635173 RepID=A0A1Y2PCJ0_9FLAO|nr:hypothetical protein [Tenacibaculum holothuriorum]OSY87507.1 hypothetical protein WH52_11630 [Tenacibaculum holothuriorum]
MNSKEISKNWFNKWENGDFYSLPITENFEHVSPFGIIKSKKDYINLVESNKDKFLNYQFNILDEVYTENKSCIRYTAIQNDFKLDVSEWHYIKNGLIEKVVAYYHIGEIKEDRKLK